LSPHNAPPVVFPLGRSRFQGQLLFGLWLAGLFVVSLWIYVAQQMDWRTVLSSGAVLVTGAAAYIGTQHVQVGQLAWDGEVWRWETQNYHGGSTEYELSVVADFQHRLLLRLQNQARYKVWLWLECQAAPERWLDLRRAVYSPHRSTVVLPPHDLLNAEPPPAVAVSLPMPPVDAAPTNS
jgi:toxin CptA